LEDYSHIPTPHSGEPVASARVLTDAIRAAEQAASKDSVRFELPEQLPAVEMRENDLLRVFSEILTNAIRYQSTGAPVVRVQCARQRHCWVFSISDQGPGMIPCARRARSCYSAATIPNILVLDWRLHAASYALTAVKCGSNRGRRWVPQCTLRFHSRPVTPPLPLKNRRLRTFSVNIGYEVVDSMRNSVINLVWSRCCRAALDQD
jgi:hypothetical protein